MTKMCKGIVAVLAVLALMAVNVGAQDYPKGPITYLVPFGGLVRNLHFWSAQFLLIISAVHLLRIIFTGAYAPPRRFNYLLGLGLLVFILLMGVLVFRLILHKWQFRQRSDSKN